MGSLPKVIQLFNPIHVNNYKSSQGTIQNYKHRTSVVNLLNQYKRKQFNRSQTSNWDVQQIHVYSSLNPMDTVCKRKDKWETIYHKLKIR